MMSCHGKIEGISRLDEGWLRAKRRRGLWETTRSGDKGREVCCCNDGGVGCLGEEKDRQKRRHWRRLWGKLRLEEGRDVRDVVRAK
jgi:hypothetical protein